ncbi:hypothetical protein CsSME_00001339 [Camellia sinensis var. sinensis]
MRNLTLYRSRSGRNVEPHALPVTIRKEHGTSRYHTLYRALLRKEGGTYLKHHALPAQIRRETDPKISS